MQLEGKHVVVTGGGGGIGKALCQAFAQAGARIVVVADINEEAARDVAGSVGGTGARCDVSREDELQRLIETAEERHGPIDLFCSNAGIAAGFTTDYSNVAAAGDEVWNRAWQINVMAHVHAARHLVPRMRSRGGG